MFKSQSGDVDGVHPDPLARFEADGSTRTSRVVSFLSRQSIAEQDQITDIGVLKARIRIKSQCTRGYKIMDDISSSNLVTIGT
jgi:hypothetical protein